MSRCCGKENWRRISILSKHQERVRDNGIIRNCLRERNIRRYRYWDQEIVIMTPVPMKKRGSCCIKQGIEEMSSSKGEGP